MMNNKQVIKCCICGKRINVTSGNNPYPVRTYSIIGADKNRSCDECTCRFVDQARLYMRDKLPDDKLARELFHRGLKSISYKELSEIFPPQLISIGTENDQ